MLTIRKLVLLGLGNVAKVLFYDLTIEGYTGGVGRECIDLIWYPNFFPHFCFNLGRFLRQVTSRWLRELAKNEASVNQNSEIDDIKL